MGQIYWLAALLCVGVSSMMGSVNYITTIINMRAPGMTLYRMPMTIWAMFITAILQAFALPVLTVALILQLLDKTIGTNFFLPRRPDLRQLADRRRQRAAAAVAASVLVLFAPGRVHHDSAGHGHGVGHHQHLRPPAAVRLPGHDPVDRRHRRAGLHRLGPSHVPERHGSAPGHRPSWWPPS